MRDHLVTNPGWQSTTLPHMRFCIEDGTWQVSF